MTDRHFNAANRKDIRAAEKAVLAAQTIDREVISGLMMVKNGRQWVYNQLAEARVFTDPFTPDPYIHAYQAGTRAVGIALFNQIVLYAGKNFNLMLEEAHERSVIADTRRIFADAEPGPEPDPYANPDSGTDASA